MGRVNTHGQVTIPKKIRDVFSIEPDDIVTFSIKNDRIVLEIDNQKEYTLETLHEFLGPSPISLSASELEDALSDSFASHTDDEKNLDGH